MRRVKLGNNTLTAVAAAVGLVVVFASGHAACIDGGELDPADWPALPGADATGDLGGDTSDVPGDAPTDLPSDTPVDVPPGDTPTDTPADAPTDVPVDTPDDAGPCVPTRDFWVATLWPTLSSVCTACHGPGGLAANSGSGFVFDGTSGTPQAQEDAYQVSRQYALEQEPGGGSKLALNPTGEATHGGGPQISVGSQLHSDLLEFVSRVENPVACDP